MLSFKHAAYKESILLYLINISQHKTASRPGTPKIPAISALATVIFSPKPTAAPIRFTSHSAAAPITPFHTSLNGSDKN